MNDPSRSPYRMKDLQKQYPHMDHITCILNPNQHQGALYLGDYQAASDLILLKSNQIGAVMTFCLQDIPTKVKQSLLYHKSYYAEDQDHFNIAKYFDETINFINDARKVTSVLVHCYAGISRSATIIIAYLMKTQQIKLKEAMRFVQQKRWQIYPNDGFVRQLQQFEKQLFKDSPQKTTQTTQSYSSQKLEYYNGKQRQESNTQQAYYQHLALNRQSSPNKYQLPYQEHKYNSRSPRQKNPYQIQELNSTLDQINQINQKSQKILLQKSEYQKIRRKYIKDDIIPQSVSLPRKQQEKIRNELTQSFDKGIKSRLSQRPQKEAFKDLSNDKIFVIENYRPRVSTTHNNGELSSSMIDQSNLKLQKPNCNEYVLI